MIDAFAFVFFAAAAVGCGLLVFRVIAAEKPVASARPSGSPFRAALTRPR